MPSLVFDCVCQVISTCARLLFCFISILPFGRTQLTREQYIARLSVRRCIPVYDYSISLH